MNKIRDIKLTAGNLSLRAELFAHGDITLAKLYSGDSSYFDGTNLDYGWAFRAPEDKPNRMKGMTVALGKAMDSAMLAPKLRHELLSMLKQSPQVIIINTLPSSLIHSPFPLPDGWKRITETADLQINSRNYRSNNMIHDLQLINANGQIRTGGFGCGLRKFWLGTPVNHHWQGLPRYAEFNPIAWRYKPEDNPWRRGTDTQGLVVGGKNFDPLKNSIVNLIIRKADGFVTQGGFGTGVRMFWGEYNSDDWFHPSNTFEWRYANA